MSKTMGRMSKAAFALAHPVFDPDTQMLPGHRTLVDRLVSACISAYAGATQDLQEEVDAERPLTETNQEHICSLRRGGHTVGARLCFGDSNCFE